MPDLFSLQPESCRLPLQPRPLKLRGKYAPLIERVLGYDPRPLYLRGGATLEATRRIQTKANLSMELLFPKKTDGLCDCGCGIPLSGRQRRWASVSCGEFAWWIYAVIAGRRRELSACLKAYYGTACAVCGDVPMKQKPRRKRPSTAIEWDHVIPVHRGGGACWLGNWMPLCATCHKAKTARDRELRKKGVAVTLPEAQLATPGA